MTARGSCPTVAAPLQTGDGLLARLIPHEPITIAKLSALCAAAQEHGNGFVEVTQRGSLQIRGLNEASAPKFARVVAALQVGVDGPPSLLTSPLLGLDPGEPFQSSTLVGSLPGLFHRMQARLERLPPKVSVLIDGGGKLHLDAVSADIRLTAVEDCLLQVSLGGNGWDALPLGYVTLDRAAAIVEVLLEMLAVGSAGARAKDLVHQGTIQEVRHSLGNNLVEGGASSGSDAASRPSSNARAPAEPIGTHRLNGGTVALGFALPFGHTTAPVLKRIAEVAADHGATSIRPCPGRAVLAIGLSLPSANDLREVAAAEGFVVDPSDARRHVVACAGAPACASAQLATRQLAPEVARATQKLAGSSNIVHLAGCSKGCAHPGQAALTIVGPDRIILNGRASDPPSATTSSTHLISDITRLSADL
jgi:precorrin-3B synthase